MREWLLRPEHFLASVLWGPMLVLLALCVSFGIWHFRRRWPTSHMLRWLLPIGGTTLAYLGWLLQMGPLRLASFLLLYGVLMILSIVALDRAVVSRSGHQRDGRDAAPPERPSGSNGPQPPTR